MSLRILQVFKIHMLHFPRAYWVRLFNPSSCRPLILRCLSNPGPLHTRLATIEAHTCVGQAASDKSPSLHRRFIRQHPASGHTTYILTAIRFALSAVFPTDLAKCQEPIVEACQFQHHGHRSVGRQILTFRRQTWLLGLLEGSDWAAQLQTIPHCTAY